jgi:serine/threonine protein kinase
VKHVKFNLPGATAAAECSNTTVTATSSTSAITIVTTTKQPNVAITQQPALQYPLSLDTLLTLQQQLQTIDVEIGHLQLNINAYSTTTTNSNETQALQAVLSDLRAQRSTSGLTSAIAHERARLCAQASAHYPELLLPASLWSIAAGLDIHSSATGDVCRVGLFAEGRRLDDFTDKQMLHSRFGKTVWRVTDSNGTKSNAKQWAVKQFSLQDDKHIRHFYRQVKLLHTLQHPNIAAVHAVFQQIDTQSVFLQMPWYSGGDLKQWLVVAVQRSATVCKQIALDVLHAVAHIHSHKQVHSDIKPANVFLTAAHRAVVGDFDGICNLDTSMSASILSAATVGYIAPEIISGAQQRFTTACDVYACGKIVQELFSDGVLWQQQEIACRDELLAQLLQLVPTDRPTAQMASHHDFLNEPLKDVNIIQCNSCYEIVPVTAGIQCSATATAAAVGAVGSTSHFTCDDCMSRYVASVVGVDAAPYQQLAMNKGCVSCPILPCTSTAFSPQTIASHLTQAVHDSYIDALRIGNESLLIPKLEADYERRLQILKDTIQSTTTTVVSNMDDTVRLAELHVIENIVTLKCPKCAQGFYDFEG